MWCNSTVIIAAVIESKVRPAAKLAVSAKLFQFWPWLWLPFLLQRPMPLECTVLPVLLNLLVILFVKLLLASVSVKIDHLRSVFINRDIPLKHPCFPVLNIKGLLTGWAYKVCPPVSEIAWFPTFHP